LTTCGDDDPSWQPLSALPMLTVIAAEGVRLAREHLNNLREAHPYRLDDASVARVISTWEVTRDDLTSCSRNRGRRWQQQARGGRRHARRRDCALVAEERGLVEDILTLAHELQAVTIERLLKPRAISKQASKPIMLGAPPSWGVSPR
jgi:hypothetical protein